MINENCMYECEWCHEDLGSDPKMYDEHVQVCPKRPLSDEEAKIMIDAVSGALVLIVSKRLVTCLTQKVKEWQRGALPIQGLRETDEQCSGTTPHAPHTWNGRPMKLCKGIPFEKEKS